MVKFFYVYILRSELDAERFYTGLTDNLIERFTCQILEVGRGIALIGTAFF